MSSIFSQVTSYLPPHPGLLPQWLFLVSLVSVANSIQAYLTISYTSRVYAGWPSSPSNPSQTPSSSTSPATPLSSRTFGTWTLIQSIVRLYAAYHIDNPQVYQMAFLTYVVAWAHFMSEWWVFRSARWGAGLAGPICVASGSLVWMWVQWGNYVKA